MNCCELTVSIANYKMWSCPHLKIGQTTYDSKHLESIEFKSVVYPTRGSY